MYDPYEDFLSTFSVLGTAPPPDSVPLRILGLDAIPATRDDVHKAFRTRVMQVHPDLSGDAFSAIPGADRAVLAQAQKDIPVVQELVWARSMLLRKVRDVTTDGAGRADPITRNTPCKRCGDERKNPRTGRPYPWVKSWSKWRGHCWPCARDAELEAQREARAVARSDKACDECGQTFTPARADGKFCSNVCRQAAYRKRRSS